MISFENQYFQKLAFTEEQLEQFLKSALHDLKIAEESDIPDVVFKFSYLSSVHNPVVIANSAKRGKAISF